MSRNGALVLERLAEAGGVPPWTGHRPAIIVMGVSGCGKSTFARALAARLGLMMVDGDDLHAEASIAKMKAGQPLDDEDRWPWLDRVTAVLGDRQRAPFGVVVACSALKRAHRDRIRTCASEPRFVFLDASPELVASRIAMREGHFMPSSLVDSQFRALERPADTESDVLNVPAGLPLDLALKITVGSSTLRERR